MASHAGEAWFRPGTEGVPAPNRLRPILQLLAEGTVDNEGHSLIPLIMPAIQSHQETFRDPAGSLRIVDDRVLRRVNPSQAGAALRFLQSPLAQEWVWRGNLVDSHNHTEAT